MPIHRPSRRRLAKAMDMRATPERRYYQFVGSHGPDRRGNFAGQRAQLRGNKYMVSLSEKQVRYWLDQGVLELAPAEHQHQEQARRPAVQVGQRQQAQPASAPTEQRPGQSAVSRTVTPSSGRRWPFGR